MAGFVLVMGFVEEYEKQTMHADLSFDDHTR